MASHYRIVQTPEGFKVQARLLWIFWNDCAEPYFSTDGVFAEDKESLIWIYDSYNDALGAIYRLKHMFYDYRGHCIQYFMTWNGNKGFVDLDSKFNYSRDKVKYSRVANSLEQMKREIDKYEKEKEKEKNKNKVLQIWNIN